jgi:hypothetical protein
MTYKVQINDLVREATQDEIAEIEARKLDGETHAKVNADRAKLKAATLAKLGLTADEIAALLS